jgi:hypothetical protein
MGGVKAAALIVAIALAGCSTRYQVNGGAISAGNAGPVPSGTSVTSGSAGLQVQSGGSAAAVLIAIGILAGMTQYSQAVKPPELAPDRRVSEQDCTKPIADPSANLKCR